MVAWIHTLRGPITLAAPILTRLLPGEQRKNAARLAGLLGNNGLEKNAQTVLRRCGGRAGGDPYLWGLGQLRRLAQGDIPEDYAAAAAAILREADGDFAAGNWAAAGEYLHLALQIAYHPVIHLGTQVSPLLATHTEFLDSLAGTKIMARLRATTPQRATRPGGKRVLFLTYGAPTFVRAVITGMQEGGLETRFRDLAEEPDIAPQLDVARLVSARVRQLGTGENLALPTQLQEDFAWADTIFVEWGHRTALWVSLLGPEKRVVVRTHRYEGQTQLPLLIAWENIDEATFVSPAVKEIVAVQSGLVRAAKTSVIGNVNDLARYDLPKKQEAAWTLGIVGWNSLVKDPLWAIDVLKRLRQTDERWRLVLIGNTDVAAPVPAQAEYFAQLREQLTANAAAITQTGFQTDIPAALREVGVILSASRIEGTHEALAQGAASGALPVCRDWPELAHWGGAAAVFPQDWVVAEPANAVERILAHTGPDGVKVDREVQLAQIQDRNWVQVKPRLLAAITGESL